MAVKKTKTATKVKANNNLVYLVFGAIVLLLVFVFMKGAKEVGQDTYMPLPEVPKNTYPAVQNTTDLDKAAKELDATDVNAMDKELNSLNSDASSL